MRPTHIFYATIVALLLGQAACKGGAKSTDKGSAAPTPTPTTPTPPTPSQPPSGDIIREWSDITDTAAMAHDKYEVPHYDDRAFAFVAIAQHDAVTSIEPRYEPYAYTGSHKGADPIAAAAQAAHDILIASYPKQDAMLKEKLAASLAKVPDGEPKQKGIEAGKAAAAALLAKRAGDGFDKVVEFKPAKVFGAWQYTPPVDNFAYGPQVGQMQGMTLTKPDQFLPPPPPPFAGERYAKDFNEVKAVGAKDSKTRTPDQSFAGQYWYEYCLRGWNRIAKGVSSEKKSDLWETARLFALLNIAIWDGWVSSFNAKYHYAPKAGIRPITAIRIADLDGNKATDPDPKWEPFMGTPPIPEYPSTHAALGAVGAAVLAHVYGDATPFTMTSPTAVPPGPRSYKSFSQAAQENADSRVWIGIHFRYATEAGLELGKKVGEHAIANALKKKQ